MPDFALISLVSGQPMPNVMAVLQDDQYFSYLEFIVSANKDEPSQYDKQYDEAYERIKVFLEKRGHIVTRQPPVDPYNLKAALEACQEAVNVHLKKGHQVVFNITGGTKVMSLAAYLCAQQNHVEAIYVESRDRFLISIPPTDDFTNVIASGSLVSKRKGFNEGCFREIDVPSYLALYGKEIDKSIQADDLDIDQINKAIIIAQHYAKLRKHLKHLQDEVKKAFKTRTLRHGSKRA